MRRAFDSVWPRVGFTRILVLSVLVGLLSGCGFHLRGAVELPEGMNKIYVQGFVPGSQFPNYLNRDLKFADGSLTPNREDAGVILRAVNEQFLRREVSLSQTGQANMYELTYKLTYDLQNPAGETIMAQQNVTIVREYFNPQVNVIGKSEEEGVIRTEMYREAVRSVLRSVEVALRDRNELH